MPKIEDYALLGDLHTAALVSTAGAIDWLCLPCFDSPAVFAGLLDNDEAGHWSLAPAAGSTCTRRRYVRGTLVLETADGRVLATIDAIRRELTEDGLVRRYRTADTDDGVNGSEGLFIACSFWLVDALHASGQQADAAELFERVLGLRNDVGLLSEEWDPADQRQLGNTPQAFSHFALIVSAVQLHMGGTASSDNPMPR